MNVRAIIAWTLYDFANSSFATVIFLSRVKADRPPQAVEKGPDARRRPRPSS